MNEPTPADTDFSVQPLANKAGKSRWLSALLAASAWLLIGALVFIVAGSRYMLKEEEKEGARPNGMGLVIFQMQARYLVGAANLVGTFNAKEGDLKSQAQSLDTGSLDQRLRFVVLAGEFFGPKEALARLDALRVNGAEKPDSDQQEIEAALRRLYKDYNLGLVDGPSLPAPEREVLKERLGWFGQLALAPQGGDEDAREAVLAPARRTCFALLGGIVGGALYGLVGLMALVTVAFFVSIKLIKFGIPTGQTPAGVYVETFALWMLLFLALSLGGQLLAKVLPEFGPWRLALTGVGMLLSLASLGWPVLRGLTWRQVREDVGLTPGRLGAAGEAGLGFLSYAMALPFLAIGLAATLVLLQVQHLLASTAGGEPRGAFDAISHGEGAHPIVEEVARGGPGMLVVIFLLACVVAPLVEEIMFRGVLYRHLRELSAGLGRFVSVFFSGLLVAFVFAVIHPQGLIAVPALMALAFSFVLLREWRGTVIPAIVAHGVNNGLVMLVLTLAVGG